MATPRRTEEQKAANKAARKAKKLEEKSGAVAPREYTDLEEAMGARGRSPNRDYDQVDRGDVTHCQKCGSSKRSKYLRRVDRPLSNVYTTRDGHQYNLIVLRPCQCLDCGQWRKDRSLELVKNKP